MALPSAVTARLGNVIRRLSSDADGEIIAAMHVILRLLQSCGGDIHALANHVQNGGGLTEADKAKIKSEIENARALGYAEGVRAAESKQHGTGAFRNTDGQLEWTEVALFVQREKQKLPSKHHEFIDDMAARTVYGREPTPKQHQYLHSLFYKLGGKIT
jgi:hypothetical protein